MKEKMVVEVKNMYGNYEVKRTVEDPLLIYKTLANDLISKKIVGCLSILRMKRNIDYEGTQTITVTYDNGSRRIYTLEKL